MSGKDRKKYCRSLDDFWNFIFPQKCTFCGKWVEDFSEFGSICFDCREKMKGEISGGFIKDSNGLDGLWYCGVYRGFLKECINRFKFFGELTIGRFLGVLLCDVILRNPLNFDIITFVPLHRKKLLSRGYNQSEVVANIVGKKMQIKVKRTFIKDKNNLPQASVGVLKRRENVKGVFKLFKKSIVAESVLIVDDVYTTGSTLRECAEILKKSGVKNIYGGVLAIDYLL